MFLQILYLPCRRGASGETDEVHNCSIYESTVQNQRSTLTRKLFCFVKIYSSRRNWYIQNCRVLKTAMLSLWSFAWVCSWPELLKDEKGRSIHLSTDKDMRLAIFEMVHVQRREHTRNETKADVLKAERRHANKHCCVFKTFWDYWASP
jgi:hypothetical protein